MTVEKKERYKSLIERRRRAFDELQAVDREIMQLQAIEPEQYTEDGDRIPIMATIQEAANRTGLSYDYIRKLCIQGKIVYIRTGSKRLVNMDKLRAGDLWQCGRRTTTQARMSVDGGGGVARQLRKNQPKNSRVGMV